mmetsp:Transcript_14613/g.41360  ORF Transcript_14613/g.41360 Transcript_14613/m.41360 type:complete len:286 (+) Transcript_14613:566-1423(+)
MQGLPGCSRHWSRGKALVQQIGQGLGTRIGGRRFGILLQPCLPSLASRAEERFCGRGVRLLNFALFFGDSGHQLVEVLLTNSAVSQRSSVPLLLERLPAFLHGPCQHIVADRQRLAARSKQRLALPNTPSEIRRLREQFTLQVCASRMLNLLPCIADVQFGSSVQVLHETPQKRCEGDAREGLPADELGPRLDEAKKSRLCSLEVPPKLRPQRLVAELSQPLEVLLLDDRLDQSGTISVREKSKQLFPDIQGTLRASSVSTRKRLGAQSSLQVLIRSERPILVVP